MKYCPLCDKVYDDNREVCEIDGATLQDARPRQDTFTGKVIKGRYRVLKKLGDGGMGAVYLAEQVAIGRNVALKVLHPDYARDQEFVRRFRQEARLAASLNHRNVITVFDFDQTDDGSLYIVMEYADGSNLARIIQDGPMEVSRAVRLAGQIAEGLEAAHRAGVIHRDVKPENIMVVGADEIKLMDFGIARLRDTGAVSRLTRAGSIMGTPAYMAPEQIDGGDVSERTDIYAFGIVLYEMLSGVAPFRAPTPAAVLIKHLQEAPIPLRKLRREIPTALEHEVSRALEKDPGKRQQNFRGVIEVLRSLQFGVRQIDDSVVSAEIQPLAKVWQGVRAIPALAWRIVEAMLLVAQNLVGQVMGSGKKSRGKAVDKRIEVTEIRQEKAKQTIASLETKVATQSEIPELSNGDPSPTPHMPSTTERLAEFNERTGKAEASNQPSGNPAPPAYSPNLTEVVAETRINFQEQNANSDILPPPIEPTPTGRRYDTVLETSVQKGVVQPTQAWSADISDTTPLPGGEKLADGEKFSQKTDFPKRKVGNWRTIGVGAGGAAVITIVILAIIQWVGNEPTKNVPIVEQTGDSISGLTSAPDSPTAQTGIGTHPEANKQTEDNVQQPKPDTGTKSPDIVGMETMPPRSENTTPVTKLPSVTKSSDARRTSVPTQKGASSESGVTKDTNVEMAKSSDARDTPGGAGLDKEKKAESPVKNDPPQIASLPRKQIEPSPTPPAAEPRFSSLVVIAGKRELTVKERVRLTVKGRYSDGKESEVASGVVWNSSDPSVAKVNSRGELEALGEGKAQITARYYTGTNLVFTFQVTVAGGQQNEKPEEGIKAIRRGTLR